MSVRKTLIAGNWKMHLSLEEASHLIKGIGKGMGILQDVDVLVAPPFTILGAARKAIGKWNILLAAQNMHWEKKGAFTGEISSSMLLESGCTHVILGHSERRNLFGESNEMIDRKASAALHAGLIPIVCIGETLEEREAGKTFEVIKTQLDNSLHSFMAEKINPSSIVLAYEPVWAIGTGRTATPNQAQEVHFFIRKWLLSSFGQETADSVRILYGGSVTPENVRGIMMQSDIDGALVGGASLKAESFVRIIRFRENG